MTQTPRSRAVPLLWLLFGAAVIAWAPILVRLSSVGETTTAFWRLVLATPLLAVAAQGASRSGSEGASPAVFVWTGVCLALDLVCWHLSIARTTVANATLFANLAPLGVALVSLALGERFRPLFWVGLALALCGAALLVATGVELGVRRMSGDALGLATAAFYAGYLLGVARLRRHVPAALVMAGVTGVAAVTVGAVLGVGFLVGLWGPEELYWPGSLAEWWPLVLLALGPQVVGQGSIAHALAFLPAAYGAVTLLFQPLAAALIAVWLFDEHLGPLEVAGMFAILGGIGLVHWTRSDAGAPAVSGDDTPR